MQLRIVEVFRFYVLFVIDAIERFVLKTWILRVWFSLFSFPPIKLSCGFRAFYPLAGLRVPYV